MRDISIAPRQIGYSLSDTDKEFAMPEQITALQLVA